MHAYKSVNAPVVHGSHNQASGNENKPIINENASKQVLKYLRFFCKCIQVNNHYQRTVFWLIQDLRYLTQAQCAHSKKLIAGQNKKLEKRVRQCKMLISIWIEDSMLHTSGEISYS